MKITQKKLIIFDLDGTLIDSVPDLAFAVNHMLHTLKMETFSEDTIRYWVGNGAQVLVKRALSGQSEIDEALDISVYEKALEIFLSYYAQHLAVKTVPYPNVNTTLYTLKEKGYRLAIVTNKPFDFVAPILHSLGMDGLSELILCGDSLSEKKPSPLPLLHLCEKLKVCLEDSLMVGDSKNDILAANACGMQSVAVTYGYNYGEEISTHNPDMAIDDFKALLEVL